MIVLQALSRFFAKRPTSPTITPSLCEVVQQLRRDHRRGYVYRGQEREYPTPLVPSQYRPIVNTARVAYDGQHRLRGSGTAFVEQLHPASYVARAPEQATQWAKRVAIETKLRNALGYPLAQVFAQQAGLWSEGLDVTTDIDVAAFFASHTFQHPTYRLQATGTGIIYRWHVQEPEASLHNLQQWDFYTCPPVLSATRTLDLLRREPQRNAVAQGMHEYRQAIGWGMDFDLTSVRGHRPFNLLCLPKDAAQSVRVYAQAAALLIPDTILSKAWEAEDIPPSASITLRQGRPLVEDLGTSRGVEAFRFRHQADDSQCIAKRQHDLFPEHDVTCGFVRGWIRSLFQDPEYGRIPMPMDASLQFFLEPGDLLPKLGYEDEFLY